MSLIHWLLEPGTTRLAVAIFWAFVALIVGCCVVGFKPARQQPHQPSTRAVTSNRKSGRTVRHG